MADWQLGLGHAFEINPEVPDSFLLELAHAQLVRQLFPDAPLKYMPPTKHMTGNVFAGYLLDAFFNLSGVMTGQSILLIGMMTEGIHTPFLSDRDLALENVRYVLRAAGRLGENFRPPPGGFVEQRAQQVLAEAVDLLRRIGAEGLLNAIADGTFGITRRPADGGRGLDGVFERANGYFNPASEFLEGREQSGKRGGHERRGAGPAVIRPYGDTTGDGRIQVSFTLPLPFGTEEERALAEGAAAQLAAKMGLEPAMVVHAKAMGPDFTFFIVYGPSGIWSTCRRSRSREREFPLMSAAEVNLRIRSASAGNSWWSAPRRRRRAHRRHRRHPQRQGARRGEGPGVLRGDPGGQPGRPGGGGGPGRPGRWPRTRTRCWSARSSPSGTRTSRPPGRSPRRSAAARGPARPLLVVGGPRFDPAMAQELGVDRVFGRGTTPREVASYLVHALAPEPRGRNRGMTAGRRACPSPTAGTCPASHAHYGGNLVDGAYVLGLFGDVATEACIRIDGDEGLFASYSDVQFRGPGACRRRDRDNGDRDPGRAPQPRPRLRGPGRVPCRPGTRAVGLGGARRAPDRGDRDRHGRRACPGGLRQVTRAP